MTPLCEIAKEYGTDKYLPHGYTPIYFRLLADRASSIRSLLEIGIGKGRSLRMWEEFLPIAAIVGIDIDPDLLINAGRIGSYAADQSDEREMKQLVGSFQDLPDVIIDDGSHDPKNQVAAMTALLPFLAIDGLYFIEDVRYRIDAIVESIPTGFGWEAYEGGKRLASGRGEVLMVIRRCST